MSAEVLGYEISLDSASVVESDTEVRRQLWEYEAGTRERFDLSIAFPATFFGRVWRAVTAIPYGETRTYGELAAELDTAPVAVGNANANNPLPVLVPCHRLVGTDSLRGYRYPGLKEALLRHENEAGLVELGFDLDGSV